MIRRSVRNMLSGSKPAMRPVELESPDLRMPMADAGCTGCGRCAEVCPERAICAEGGWSVDLGRCIFCYDCMDSCPEGHIHPADAPDYALRREDLVVRAGEAPPAGRSGGGPGAARALKGSVSIRVLDTGSCNACDVELACMSNKYYDMERFGLKVTASPRHADVLLVTGPMTENMADAALRTYRAMPEPKIVVAVGACAISGGIFGEGSVAGSGIADTIPADVFIPGCPPSPRRVMRSLLKVLGRDH